MFTVSGLWLIFNSGSTAEVGAGLLSVIFFGGGGLYAIPKIVRRKFTMILSADGIRQQYAQGTTFIPWADVEKIGLIKIFGNKLVGIRLRTYDQYLNNMSPELAEFTLKTLPYMRLMAKATTLLPTQSPLELWSAFEGSVLAKLLELRRRLGDPVDGLGEAFLAEIQPLLETPWAVAMADLIYPQTRGDRPPDFEKKLQYTHALMRLTAEDAEADKILAEVRSLLKPQSALHEPELASRVMSMTAPA